MRNVYKIMIGLVVFLAFFPLLNPIQNAQAGSCQTQITFNAQPNPVPFNQNITFSGTVSISGFEPPGTANAGFCLTDGRPVRAIIVRLLASGFSLSDIGPINLTAFRSEPYPFSKTIKPSDFGKTAGSTFAVAADVYPSDNNVRMVNSSVITVTLTAGVYGTFACVDSGGIYRCSPGIKSDCSDVTACTAAQKQVCRTIPDTSQCGRTAASSQTYKACQNNACVQVQGQGTDSCTTDANCTGGRGGGGGGTSTQNFEIPNPIGINTFQELVNVIGTWIFNLAIPIAVIIIIYAGVLMLTSGGNPTQFQKGTKALWYAVLGLAVVLIGKGFVTLIQSILSLKN